jgi:NADPH-dependent glutamate synthase beta subunit-like oxidoreductase
MNVTMQYTEEWDKVLRAVATCIDCPNPPCMRACPQSVNIRDALRFLIETHPAAARHKALEMAARLDPDWGKGCE